MTSSKYQSAMVELHLVPLKPPKGDTEIQRTPLTASNLSTVAEYYRIYDRVMRYVNPVHNTTVEIQSIERIANPVLDKRLYKVHSRMHRKDCIPELLIHGTKGENAESIIGNGFNIGKTGMFGAGIYFATDSTKSAKYARDNSVKTLLLCDVLLGKTMICKASNSELNLESVEAKGYDSVFAKRGTKQSKGVLNDEYIVYRSEQAAPRYLVKFTT